jgi:hypothetical protein
MIRINVRKEAGEASNFLRPSLFLVPPGFVSLFLQ